MQLPRRPVERWEEDARSLPQRDGTPTRPAHRPYPTADYISCMPDEILQVEGADPQGPGPHACS